MRFLVLISLWIVSSWLCIEKIPEVAKTKVLKPNSYSLSKLRLCHVHITGKNCQTFLCNSKCATQVSGPAQTTCIYTLSSIHTGHFSHTILCIHNPTKDSAIYVCLHAQAQKTITLFPCQLLDSRCFSLHMYSICEAFAQLYSLYFLVHV